MTNWLMVSPIHSEYLQSEFVGRPWPYRVVPNQRLEGGDLVYLLAGHSGLYGWGYVNKIERYQDSELGKEMMKISVSRPVVRPGIVSFATIDQTPGLANIIEKLDGNFVDLTPKQVNALNSLIRLSGADAPPDVVEIRDRIGKFGVRDNSSLHAKLSLAIEAYNLASILFMDLDNFKSVNDEHSHAIGDRVIRETLEVVQRAIANEGELFHRSGDEIITLLPNFNSSDSSKVAERIRAAIERKSFSVIGQGFVTVTIGSATYPDNCDRWEDLEERADQTLSQAKKIRKNWVLVAEKAGANHRAGNSVIANERL